MRRMGKEEKGGEKQERQGDEEMRTGEGERKEEKVEGSKGKDRVWECGVLMPTPK